MPERAGLKILILFKTYLGQSKTLFGCQVVQKPTEVIKIFLTALQLVSMCSSMDRCRQKAPRLTIRRVIWILAFDTEYLYLSTQPTYLQILRGQCCFLLVVNMVTGSLGQPFSHENPSVNAALHGFHMQIHLSIIIIHLLPRWGHFCLNLTENCQSL